MEATRNIHVNAKRMLRTHSQTLSTETEAQTDMVAGAGLHMSAGAEVGVSAARMVYIMGEVIHLN